jgi:hypothetical protein
MLIYIIIFAAIAARFVPHMPNFAPITALAIFSAANMGWKKSVGLTLAVRLISDIFLGFFAWPLMLAVYASHLVGVLFGLWIKKTTSLSLGGTRDISPQEGRAPQIPSPSEERVRERLQSWTKVISSSLFASVIFFLVTNFAFLYPGYTHNIAGITAAYVNGLPFLRGTLLGDLGYTSALFGAYQFALYAKTINRLKRAIA